MVDTLCVVQARMGSSRLPGKVLQEVGGMPMLAFLLSRLATAKVDRVVVATSDLAQDDPVEEVARGAGFDVVRGSERDVLARFRSAIAAHPAEVVVRITGDCPLTDPALVDEIVRLHLERSADYTSNVLPRTYPKGLDVQVANAPALLAAADEATDPAEREHVMPFLYRRPERFTLANLWCDDDLGDESWTVDTAGDLAFVRSVVERLPVATAGWRDVLAIAGRHAQPAAGVVSLRPARATDAGTVLRWRNDEAAVRFSPSGAVDPERHAVWFAGRLADPGTQLFMARLDGNDVGFVRVDVRTGAGEVSIAVAPEHRGRGLATRMLAAAQEALPPDQQVVALTATIHPGNEASVRAFHKAGFDVTGEDGGYLVLRWP